MFSYCITLCSPHEIYKEFYKRNLIIEKARKILEDEVDNIVSLLDYFDISLSSNAFISVNDNLNKIYEKMRVKDIDQLFYDFYFTTNDKLIQIVYTIDENNKIQEYSIFTIESDSWDVNLDSYPSWVFIS